MKKELLIMVGACFLSVLVGGIVVLKISGFRVKSPELGKEYAEQVQKSEVRSQETNDRSKVVTVYKRGGVDWSSMTPRMDYLKSKSSEYVSIIDYTGSGYLLGVKQRGSTSGYLKIVIDGTTVYENIFSMDGMYGMSGISFIHRFKTSLKVYHKGNARTWVSYVTE